MPNLAKLCVALAFFSSGASFAQGEKPPSPPAPEALKRPSRVRAVSAGATLSVLGLSLVPKDTVNTSTTTPAVSTQYDTKGASQRIGGGVTGQVALPGRFAVSASLLWRKIGYQMETNVATGATTTTFTARHEDTRAKIIDVPVAVRYFSKGHHESGQRWFVEGGGVFRKLSGLRTSVDTTDNNGVNTCCDTTPVTPAHRSVRGFLGGLGLYLIDPVGVRVIPEVRYTRWATPLFDNFSTHTQRNQVEGMLSITF